MLANFSKGFIIDFWWSPECASKFNSIKSYKKVKQKLSWKTANFTAWNTAGIKESK